MKNFFVGLFTATVLVFGAAEFTQLDAQRSFRFKASDPLPSNLFVELAKHVNPAVVNISTTSQPMNVQGLPPQFGPRDPFFDFFEQFMSPRMPRQPQQGLGTGFIIRKDGLILTNAHVVQGADIIKVQLSGTNGDKEELFEAELIGQDQRSDIALIRIKAKGDLPVLELGTSADLQVGEWVLAVGNPFGHSHTVTSGIVSAIGREIDEINRYPFIQTDASINPGNSGGPLVNTEGKVIGVNSAIDARAQGIGFAIPIDEVKAILPILEKEGRIRRAFLGVQMSPYPLNPAAAAELGLPTTEGALILGVEPGTPAHKSGLREYDLITKIAGKRVNDSSELTRAIGDLSVGNSYPLEYIRDGKKRTTQVTLAQHPETDEAPVRKRLAYTGQKAPFDLGFSVINYSLKIAREMGLPGMKRPAPIVINVVPDSPAARSGLSVGDLIVDVNRKPVRSEIDVLKALKKNQINTLRILRGGMPALIYINPKRD